MAAYKRGRAELDEAEAIAAWRKEQNEVAAASRKSIEDRIAGLQLEEEATAPWPRSKTSVWRRPSSRSPSSAWPSSRPC